MSTNSPHLFHPNSRPHFHPHYHPHSHPQQPYRHGLGAPARAPWRPGVVSCQGGRLGGGLHPGALPLELLFETGWNQRGNSRAVCVGETGLRRLVRELAAGKTCRHSRGCRRAVARFFVGCRGRKTRGIPRVRQRDGRSSALTKRSRLFPLRRLMAVRKGRSRSLK